MEHSNLKSFTDLIAWKESHALCILVYSKIAALPSSERYNLACQLQRAVVSISSNISEGFSRKTYPDKIQFLYIALGSTKEVQSQLLLCRDLGYISPEDFNALNDKCNLVGKLLMGLIKSFEEKRLSKGYKPNAMKAKLPTHSRATSSTS